MHSDEERDVTDIAFFLVSLSGGGAEKVAVQLANGFADRGYNIDIVLIERRGPYLSEVDDEVNIVDLESSPLLPSILPLVSYLRKTKPQYIVSNLMGDSIIAIWANTLARTKTENVVCIHSKPSMADFQGITENILPTLARIFYPWADYKIAVSRAAANDASAYLNIDKPTVIYNPFDIKCIQEQSVNQTQELVDEQGEFLFTAVGRLSYIKDFETLLRAFALLLEDLSASLLILGEGSGRESLENLVIDLGIEEHVSMPGFIENPYPYMRRSDTVVLSSLAEGFGNVIVEALACGTPVVSTDCGGPTEILKDGEYGHIVPIGDVNELSRAMKNSVHEPPSEEQLLSRAQDFSVDRILQEYENVLFRENIPGEQS